MKGNSLNQPVLVFGDKMRDNEIRLSDSEKQRLKQHRDAQFDKTVPYGFVVNRLLDEVDGQ